MGCQSANAISFPVKSAVHSASTSIPGRFGGYALPSTAGWFLIQFILHDTAHLAFTGSAAGAAIGFLLQFLEIVCTAGRNALPNLLFGYRSTDADLARPHQCK